MKTTEECRKVGPWEAVHAGDLMLTAEIKEEGGSNAWKQEASNGKERRQLLFVILYVDS